ncbi:MAG: FHA domain-containing protein [Actinobacteria bacterium]|uniref:Unannotated protein n=1 Tax=freshwater metagenome TaxID=449393 RepID=A0A6J7NGR6_9ZZZZ|nr:FHA domain-containing protein [Actinomycetota bacterium]MSW41083.1 FHA domain-containing protein [Actinomycetota bacterium]
MSDLALTLIRLGFLALLWIGIFAIVGVLSRDLRAPREARPAGSAPAEGEAHRNTQPRAAKPAKPRRGAPRTLVVTEGALAGTVVPLGTAPVTLGRASDSTLVLDDDYASNHHARLYQHDSKWIVEDLGSTNGTWIERTRITAPTVLPNNVPLKVGRSTMELRK